MAKMQAFDGQGNLVREWDDDTRTFRDLRDGTSRPYTPEENQAADERLTAESERTNERSIEDKARQAIALNRDYLALSSPTNAQIRQQVDRLTRECNALLRMALGDFTADDA